MKTKSYSLFCLLTGLLLTANCLFGQSISLPELKVQEGHPGAIFSAALSPDGKFAVSCAQDRTLKLWEVASGKEMRTLYGHKLSIQSVAFSPDGKHALSTGYDRTLIIWDLASGKAIKSLSGHTDLVKMAVYSPDGAYVLSGADDCTLKLWDLASGKEARTLAGHGSGISSLAFSPDGSFILSGSYDKTLKLWDAATGKEIRTFAGHGNFVNAVAFSPDGRLVYSGSADNTIRRWETESGKLTGIFPRASGYILSMAVSPDGKFIAIGTEKDYQKGATLRLWDLANVREIKRLFDFTESISAVAFTPDGKYLFSGSFDKTLRLWEVASGKEIRRFSSHAAIVESVAFSPDGRYGLVGADDNTLKLWELASGKIIRTFSGHSHWVTSAAFSPDGKFVLSGSGDKTLKLWEAATGQEIRTFAGHSVWIYSAVFSRDGRYILSGGGDNTLRLWETATGKEIRTFLGQTNPAYRVAISPDGKYGLSGTWQTVKLWDIASGKELRTFPGHDSMVTAVAFSPDGATALSGGNDKKLKLWETANGKLLRTFYGHQDGPHAEGINSVAFSPDGKFALSGAGDKTLKLWDLKTGRQIRTFAGHAICVKSAAFSPDGKYILSGSEDKTVKYWDIASGACLYTALANPDGSQWLCWTDDGYWDGSPDCGELVAMVRGMDVWNIDQFAVRNNRPDIIAERSGAAPEVVAEFAAAFRKRLRKLGLEESALTNDYRVPVANILQAKLVDFQDRKFVDLALAFAADGKPLTRYQIFANDVPVFGALGKAIGGMNATATERLELINGTNKIEVSCMDAGGAESFRANRLFNVDRMVKPNLYYLAFGVSDYADPGIRDLKYAAKDALALETMFKGMAGKDYAQVFSRVFTDAQVTRSAIGEAKNLLGEAHPEDVFVLFISGHGIQTGSSPSRTYFYITANSRLSDIPGTAADFDAIEDLLQGIPPRQKLFLMDTCESGEADESSPRIAAAGSTKGLFARTLSPQLTRGLAVIPKAAAQASSQRDRWIYNDLVRRSGAIVFSSSRGNEASLEADQWQQGAFTYTILQALRDPAADKDKNGIVSTDELRAYVLAAVPKLVQTVDPNAQQHPTVDRDNLYAKFGFPLVK